MASKNMMNHYRHPEARDWHLTFLLLKKAIFAFAGAPAGTARETRHLDFFTRIGFPRVRFGRCTNGLRSTAENEKSRRPARP